MVSFGAEESSASALSRIRNLQQSWSIALQYVPPLVWIIDFPLYQARTRYEIEIIVPASPGGVSVCLHTCYKVWSNVTRLWGGVTTNGTRLVPLWIQFGIRVDRTGLPGFQWLLSSEQLRGYDYAIEFCKLLLERRSHDRQPFVGCKLGEVVSVDRLESGE